MKYKVKEENGVYNIYCKKHFFGRWKLCMKSGYHFPTFNRAMRAMKTIMQYEADSR